MTLSSRLTIQYSGMPNRAYRLPLSSRSYSWRVHRRICTALLLSAIPVIVAQSAGPANRIEQTQTTRTRNGPRHPMRRQQGEHFLAASAFVRGGSFFATFCGLCVHPLRRSFLAAIAVRVELTTIRRPAAGASLGGLRRSFRYRPDSASRDGRSHPPRLPSAITSHAFSPLQPLMKLTA